MADNRLLNLEPSEVTLILAMDVGQRFGNQTVYELLAKLSRERESRKSLADNMMQDLQAIDSALKDDV